MKLNKKGRDNEADERANRKRKLRDDRDALLKALKEMKSFGRIKYGNLNQDFNDAWERANTAIEQAEKEG